MNISVVIPSHNAARWLPICLESVKEQSVTPTECIVVNDNSSDGTSILLESYQTDSLKVLDTTYGNAAAARNTGVEAASGQWIAFLDADDIWYPDHLERAQALLKGCGSVGYISHADVFSAYDDEVVRRQCRWPFKGPVADLEAETFIKVCASQQSLHTPSMVISRERFLDIGGFDRVQKRRHDIDMWLRLIHNHRWCYDPVATLAYRYDTPGSISRAQVEALYYMYTALKKNESRYPNRYMKEWIRDAAYRSLLNARVLEPEIFKRLDYTQLRKELTILQKCVVLVAGAFPPVAKQMKAWRHKYLVRSGSDRERLSKRGKTKSS